MKPNMFFDTIKEYFEENDVYLGDLDIDNVDFEYEFFLNGEDSPFRFYHGATRGCFMPLYKSDYVFKFDFDNLQNSYCFRESEIYAIAEQYNLGFAFAKIKCFDEIDNTRIYLQEKVYRYSDSLKQHSVEELKSIRDKTSNYHENTWMIPPEWSLAFVDTYGEEVFDEFLEFCVEQNINDLTESNIGYTKEGLPIAFDFAGYHELS